MNQDFVEMLSALNARGVEFMIVGSYATAYHGYTRATKDLDLWVSGEPENGRRLYRALAEFGVPGRHLEAFDAFLQSDEILQIGVAPNRIDIMTRIPGVEFAACWANRVKTQFGGEPVCLISLNDHMKSKAAAGREQDRLDIKMLQKRRREK